MPKSCSRKKHTFFKPHAFASNCVRPFWGTGSLIFRPTFVALRKPIFDLNFRFFNYFIGFGLLACIRSHKSKAVSLHSKIPPDCETHRWVPEGSLAGDVRPGLSWIFGRSQPPEHPLDRRGPPGTSTSTSNQARRPNLKPCRCTQKNPPDCETHRWVPEGNLAGNVRPAAARQRGNQHCYP